MGIETSEATIEGFVTPKPTKDGLAALAWISFWNESLEVFSWIEEIGWDEKYMRDKEYMDREAEGKLIPKEKLRELELAAYKKGSKRNNVFSRKVRSRSQQQKEVLNLAARCRASSLTPKDRPADGKLLV